MALQKLFKSSLPFLLSQLRNPVLSRTGYKEPVQNFFGNFFLHKFYSSENKNDDNKSKSNSKNFKARHNYPEALEAAVNHQILNELNASMVYLSMFCYYGRTDIALPGCQMFFKSMYDEEQEHALQFIEYQLLRGGKVHLFPVTVPESMDWTCITIAMGIALEMEKGVKEKLEELVKLAECHHDWQLADFVTSQFLKEQNDSICEMGRLVTKAKRLVDTGGVGRHLFDKEIFNYVKQKRPDIKLPFKNI